MERARVLQIYAELETLAVPLQNDPTLGPTYLQERMILCRQHQDRVSSLFTEVSREFGSIRQAVRSQKGVLALTSDPQEQTLVRRQLESFENQEDDLRYLIEAVKAKGSNLRVVSSDIRSLKDLLDQSLRLGEVRQHRPAFKGTSTAAPEPTNSEPTPELPQIESSTELPATPPVQNEEVQLAPSTPALVVSELDAEAEDIDAILDEGFGTQEER